MMIMILKMMMKMLVVMIIIVFLNLMMLLVMVVLIVMTKMIIIPVINKNSKTKNWNKILNNHPGKKQQDVLNKNTHTRARVF